MYEINRIYIWQNLVGKFAHLNGVETTVTGECIVLGLEGGSVIVMWPTDTTIPGSKGECFLFAEKGDLRPKYPPSGEESILSLFTLTPELEPA